MKYKQIDTPPCQCPQCSRKIAVISHRLDNVPAAGKPTICVGCAALLVFNEDMTVRVPTEAEIIRFEKNPLLFQVLKYTQIAVRLYRADPRVN